MTECVHHWILNPPSGPTVKGECKLCKEIREFPSVSDFDLRSPNQRRQGDALRFWRMNTPDSVDKQL